MIAVIGTYYSDLEMAIATANRKNNWSELDEDKEFVVMQIWIPKHSNNSEKAYVVISRKQLTEE